MRIRIYGAGRVEDIQSLTPGFVQRIIKKTGRPDDFFDSPQGSFAGIGNLASGPSAEAISRLETDVRNIGKTATQSQANFPQSLETQ